MGSNDFKFKPGNLKFININILKSGKGDLSNFLEINNITFNTFIDRSGIKDKYPLGEITNGAYKNGEIIHANPDVNCYNIGVILEDIKNISEEMKFLKQKLIDIHMETGIRLSIGNTIYIINTDMDNDPVFLKLDSNYIVDVVFKYFNDIF